MADSCADQYRLDPCSLENEAMCFHDCIKICDTDPATVLEALTAMREHGFDVLVSDFNVVSHMTAVPSPAPGVVLHR